MKAYEESERTSHSDTEITLGTRSILGIFFVLALVCGIFFGFGYSLGRGSAAKASLNAQTPAQANAAQPAAVNPPNAAPPIKTIVEQSSAAEGPEPKPPAGAPIAAPVAAAPTVASTNAAPPAATPASVPQVTRTIYTKPAQPTAVPAGFPATPSQAAPAQSIMVQIAAVSSRNDADALVTALQKLGYRVSARSEPGDQLLHIQIGPFATRDAAKAMRARLLNDGYNAILK